jgi:hypothetical protein
VSAFFGLWVVYGQLSPGAFNDDDIVHYFMARESLAMPQLWISLWGRPLFTFLYAWPARLGYGAVEVTTALIMSITLWLTWRLAHALRVRAALAAVLFTAFQPFFFKLGYSSLVEPLGALCFTGSLLALLARRDLVAAALAGLVPLARLEMAPLLLFVLVPIARRRRWGALLVAAVPVVIWNLAGWYFEGNPLWLPSVLAEGRFTRSLVGQSFWHYFKYMPMVVGAAAMPFFALGLSPERGSRPVPGRNLVRAIFAVQFGVLVLLAWKIHDFGGSVGYLRHFVAVGPLIGVIAAMGADRWGERAGSRRELTHRVALAGAGVLLCLALWIFGWWRQPWEYPVNRGVIPGIWTVPPLVAVIFLVLDWRRSRGWYWGIIATAAASAFISEPPIRLDSERQAVLDVVNWYKAQPPGRVIAVNHPWFFFLGGYERRDDQRFPKVTMENLERLQPGSFVVWEAHYSYRLGADVRPEYFVDNPRFVLRQKDVASKYFWYAVFEVVEPGQNP